MIPRFLTGAVERLLYARLGNPEGKVAMGVLAMLHMSNDNPFKDSRGNTK